VSISSPTARHHECLLMDPQAATFKQHTHHPAFDVQSASSRRPIVYQCGADLWLLDLQYQSERPYSHHPLSPISTNSATTGSKSRSTISPSPTSRPMAPPPSSPPAAKSSPFPLPQRTHRQSRRRFLHPIPRSPLHSRRKSIIALSTASGEPNSGNIPPTHRQAGAAQQGCKGPPLDGGALREAIGSHRTKEVAPMNNPTS